MRILDSNLWVFGTLQTNDRATTLLGTIEQGETISAISEYMVQEVLAAFGRIRELTPTERDEYRSLFLTRLTRMTGLIEAPSQRDVATHSLEDRRRATEIQLLAQILEIQPKDIPILVLAYRHIDREPTILTNDAAFAACTLSDHNLPEITIEHVA